MATLQELRDERISKLNKLREMGVNPFPATSTRSEYVNGIVQNFGTKENEEVVVAGRVVAIRSHGKVSFLDLKDISGKIQLYIKEENMHSPNYDESELGFRDLGLLDMGDFVEASGRVVKTQKGEISVEVSKVRILTKALRPLPDKWGGLSNKETRMRRRYLDTNVNEEVFERFLRRSRFWEAHRTFFKEADFVEINIPVLEHIPGGADAKPFVTHMDALGEDYYLRISQELYLKRLIGGGYEKVYEIGPRFRNEGISDEHLPEHIAMEFYWAYASIDDGKKFVTNLFQRILDDVYDSKRQFRIRGHDVDFSKGWEEIDFGEVMRDAFGFNVYDTNLGEVNTLLEKNGVYSTAQENLHRRVDKLWKHIRKDISGPAFLVNHPAYISPLAKDSADNKNAVERLQPIVAGTELGNGWSEITDPQYQLECFKKQEAMRKAGDKEAQFLDIDYVEMLEYGMPPTFGYGHSERVFWFLEDIPAREGVPFPQLRYELDETTKKIYGLK